MKTFTHSERLMGTAFTLGVVHDNEILANELLQIGVNEIKRLEALLSEFKEDAITSKINREAHLDWVSLDEESFGLIKRCLAISKLCNGDFDITVSPLKRLFQFKNTDFEMPQSDVINKTLEHVGYQKIQIDESRKAIRFLQEGMSISFAAIGKGFAADKVIALWKTLDINNAFVNASGDIKAIGKNERNEPWNVGIAKPDAINSSLFQLALNNNAIATSGNSEQHFLWKGKKYAHNINPHTGQPLQGIKSVTIIAPSAELADALATAAYVKGAQNGIDFINQLPHTFALIIDDNNKVHLSKNIDYEIHPNHNATVATV